MKYYLETNAIISLGEMIANITGIEIYTSIFTLLEIVSGMNESNYLKRKSNINTIFKSKIEIINCFPEQMLSSNFPDLQFIEKRQNDFYKTCKLILKFNSIKEIRIESQKCKLEFDFDFFNTEKQNWNNYFVSINNKGIQELWAKIKKIDYYRNKSKNILNYEDRKIIKGKFIFEVAKLYSLQIGRPDLCDVIYQNYSGNTYYFFESFIYYNINKIELQQNAKKNDIHDLSHFLYLKNFKEVKIVSNDKLISKICNSLWKDKYCSISDFLDITRLEKHSYEYDI